jgi:hypothetical protein
MNGNGREIVNYETVHDVPAIADDNLVAIAKAAEARVDAMNRIKRAALRVTNAHDWTDQGGRPYIWASGAEKIARLFGISWRLDEPSIMTEEDGHYSYTFKGYFRMGAVEIEVEGSRSSKDAFFSRKKGADVPPSEIDRNNVRKAALTNCLGNGVTRLLGIRNLSWADLDAANIKREDVGKVEYATAEMSEEAQTQKDATWKMLLEMGLGKPENAKKLLVKATAFTGKDGKEVPGKNDLNKISEKQMAVTYGKVKDAYEKWQKEKAKKQKKQDAPEEERAETSDEIAKGFAEEMGDGKDGQQTIG